MAAWSRRLFVGSLLLLIWVALQQHWLDFLADGHQLASFLHRHNAAGLWLVLGAGSLFTAMGGPRQLLAFALGYALDASQGVLFSTLATLVGAGLCFLLARTLLRPILTKRLGLQFSRFEQLFAQKTTSKILLVRLFPVGSNLLTNLAAGAAGIRFWPFIVGSGLGYLPQMLVFALAGSGVGNTSQLQFAISAGLLVISSLLGGYLYHQQRHQSLAHSLPSRSLSQHAAFLKPPE